MVASWLTLVPWLLVTTPPPMPHAPSDTFLREYAQTRRFRQGLPAGARVTPDGQQVLFLRSSARSPVQSLFSFDVATGQTREVLHPDALLHGASQTLSAEERARLERQRILARGFTGFVMAKDGSRVALTLSGRPYVLELACRKVTPVPVDGALDPQFSPDGKFLAYVREHDLHVFDLKQHTEHAVTRGGREGLTHGLAEFVAQEEMGRSSGYWWSPDSQHLAYEEVDDHAVERLTIVDPVHPEAGGTTVPYPRAGRSNVQARLGIISVRGGATTWVDWDVAKQPYLAAAVWPTKGPLTVLLQNRLQTEETLYAVDVSHGTLRPLLTEKDDAWINLVADMPHWLQDGSGFFWVSERQGAPEVELRHADGSFAATWVGPEAHFMGFNGYDDVSKTLYFTSAPTPPERAVMSVTQGGTPVRLLPSEGLGLEGMENGVQGSTLALVRSSLRGGPTFPVLRAGKLVGTLPSEAAPLPLVPQVEFRQVGTGQQKLSTFLLRPQNAVPHTKLPVLVSVYGGPTQNVVLASANALQLDQWLANQGFLVVAVDNRGTPGRGHAWERAVRGDFSGVTLEDQVAGVRALAAEVPEMDLAHVGIFGWSFGGYMSALAVLKRPDFFKAAMAGAPVVDWLDYDTHYTERYLGLPSSSPEAYRKSSLLTYANGLQGRLLLVHGTADDNVYFFHSLKLMDGLLRAGKSAEFLPLAGQTHSVAEPVLIEHLWERAAAFFHEALKP